MGKKEVTVDGRSGPSYNTYGGGWSRSGSGTTRYGFRRVSGGTRPVSFFDRVWKIVPDLLLPRSVSDEVQSQTHLTYTRRILIIGVLFLPEKRYSKRTNT